MYLPINSIDTAHSVFLVARYLYYCVYSRINWKKNYQAGMAIRNKCYEAVYCYECDDAL